MLELHRSRFVEWQPAAVVAIAVAPGGTTVALARETGDLEIYDTADWRCTARVPGHEGAAVSSLAWCAPYALDDATDALDGASPALSAYRLLSAGLDGQITEWDLTTLRPRGNPADSHGGSVWAMAAEPAPAAGAPQRVAVACDDGCVRLLTLAAGDGVGAGLHHRRGFNRVDGRLLSLAWNPGGHQIAAGSSKGAIHVFDVALTQELARITVGQGDAPRKSDERCVWALEYLPCGTLVSGSSDGDVTFWDGRHGTQLSSHRQHRADVLALAASPDGSVVFASGVDSQVAAFERVVAVDDDGVPLGHRWTFTGTKRPHTHDVRALAIAAIGGAPVLLSGGNDAQLLAYPANAFRKRHPVRVVSVPQTPPIAITGGGAWTKVEEGKTKSKAAGGKNGSKRKAGGGEKEDGEASVAFRPNRPNVPNPPLLLCDHGRWLDVWRLGEGLGGGAGAGGERAKKIKTAEGGVMKLAAAPRHVLRAKLGGKRRTLCSAISPDGTLIAVSDTHALRLFELRPGASEGEEWTLRKQDSPEGGVSCAHLLLFTPDGKVLVAVGASGAVNVIDLESWEVMEVLKQHLPKPSLAAKALAAKGNRAKASLGGKDDDGGKTAVAVSSGGGPSDAHVSSRAVSTSDVGCPAVSHACASADGQWLALVTTADRAFGGRDAAGVHVYNLDALKLHAALPPPPGKGEWPPVAAIALSQGGVLAIAARDNAVYAYDVESASLSEWSERLASRAERPNVLPELADAPGQIRGLSFDPTPGSSVLLAQTPSAIARIDLGVLPEAPGGAKGRRGEASASASSAEGKKGRRRGAGGSEAPGKKGGDVKVAKLEDPCLFLGYFAPGRAVMVERPWKDVLKNIPEPMYRHRFGT